MCHVRPFQLFPPRSEAGGPTRGRVVFRGAVLSKAVTSGGASWISTGASKRLYWARPICILNRDAWGGPARGLGILRGVVLPELVLCRNPLLPRVSRLYIYIYEYIYIYIYREREMEREGSRFKLSALQRFQSPHFPVSADIRSCPVFRGEGAFWSFRLFYLRIPVYLVIYDSG